MRASLPLGLNDMNVAASAVDNGSSIPRPNHQDLHLRRGLPIVINTPSLLQLVQSACQVVVIVIRVEITVGVKKKIKKNKR